MLLPLLYAHWLRLHEVPYEEFKYPLEINMTLTVENIQRGKPVHTKPVFPSSSTSLINPQNKCKINNGRTTEIFYLLLIKSKLDNFEMRDAIRDTWAQEGVAQYPEVRRVFLLGYRDMSLQRQIVHESLLHGDIVQQDFTDKYFNNTLKTRMAYEWATNFCKNAKYLVFVDDDFYLAPWNLVPALKNISEDKVYGAGLMHTAPIRHYYNKWYATLQEYKFSHFPPYPSGGVYFMTSKTARKITLAIPYVQFIKYDDVYVGIVCLKLGIKTIPLKKIHLRDINVDQDTIGSEGFRNADVLYKEFKKQKLSHDLRRKFENKV